MSRIGRYVHGCERELSQTSVLVVGVGGIGCEVLKAIAKLPLKQVDILDLDTIEISNLNRQFLFQARHKGMSKALVARQSILTFNPALNIRAHHQNIKELPVSFFQQFNLLILALDNIEARNYVNRIGVRLGIPIIDAGTLAYKGNCTTILGGLSQCYSCEPKSSSQKSYPVCTIRSRPQKPIHCVVWAKMLYEVFFAGNRDNDMNDLAALSMKETDAVLRQLFHTDIENIRTAKTDSENNKLAESYLKRIRSIPLDQLAQRKASIAHFQHFETVLPIPHSISIFAEAFELISKDRERLGAVPFEKDDDQAIHFVSAAANLRMHCFSIEGLSFNEVKNMAGNIVPAIASTNAIVSGLEVLELLRQLRGRSHQLKTYFVQNQPSKIIPLKLDPPRSTCTVCSPTALPAILKCNFSATKLEQVVELIQAKSPGLTEFSLNKGEAEIFNSDEPSQTLLNKSLEELGGGFEFDLILTDQSSSQNVCTLWLIHYPDAQQLGITDQFKLLPVPKGEAMEAEEKVGASNPADENDSDLVVCGEESADQVEVVEVLKRPNLKDDIALFEPHRKKNKTD